MDFAKITAMLALAQASLDLDGAERGLASAKFAYRSAWHTFERGGDDVDSWVPPEERIGRGHPLWDEVVAATKNEYEIYKSAKRAAYNAKRRWETACRKARFA
jgi:hypothetical protein